MKKDDIEHIFGYWSKKNPHPVTELNYTNPYTLLVSVVLSAQSTDIGVNKATEQLWKTIKTPEQMIILGETNLKKHIKNIGLQKKSARTYCTLV